MRALGVVLLLVAMSLAACGTDDPAADAPRPSGEPSAETTPEVPAYFTDLETLTHDLDEANTAADDELRETLASTPPESVGDVFSGVALAGADRFEAVIAEITALTPAPGTETAHTELVAAAGGQLVADRDYANSLAGLTSDELEQFDTPAEFLAAEARLDAACAAVQALADEAGASVDLCVGVFAEPR